MELQKGRVIEVEVANAFHVLGELDCDPVHFASAYFELFSAGK